MNLVAKVIVWIVLSLFAALGAKAEDVSPPQDVQAARLVICDTAEKAQRFAAQHHVLQAAIAADDQASGKQASSASPT